MTDPVDPMIRALGPHRREVLVLVRPGGTVEGCLGGGDLGWDVRPPTRLDDAVHPGQLDHVRLALDQVDPGGTATVRIPGAIRVQHADGRWLVRQAEVEGHGTGDGAAWVLRLLRPLADTTLVAEPPLDRFELLAEVVTTGILTADADGLVTYANPAARELLWGSDDALRGNGWLRAVHPDDRSLVEDASVRVRDGGTTEIVDFRVQVGGIDRWVRARFNAIETGIGNRSGWVAVFGDITADRENAAELARRATHDPLTELPNRSLLEDRLALALARCRRHQRPITALFLDLDRFKAINDLHGHHAGEEVLRETAARLRRVVRAEDTAARLGGDEFVVVAEGVDRTVAGKVADRIAAAIAAPFDVEGQRISLRASIGIAWSGSAEVSIEELLDAADGAMYEAKRTDLGITLVSLA